MKLSDLWSFALCGIVLFWASACSRSVQVSSDPWEVAVRHGMELARRDMHGVGTPHAWCLSVAPESKVTPTTGRLAQFKDDSPPVYAADRCTMDKTTEFSAPDGRGAWLLWGTFLDSTSTTSSVEVGYHAGSLLAASWVCEVRQVGTMWNADDCKLKWIS